MNADATVREVEALLQELRRNREAMARARLTAAPSLRRESDRLLRLIPPTDSIGAIDHATE